MIGPLLAGAAGLFAGIVAAKATDKPMKRRRRRTSKKKRKGKRRKR